MNPEAIDIVQYFRESNPKLLISVCTNGSARDTSFWTSLARLNVEVSFCLDGLEDTHKLYRQNTSWKTILKNASAFISAGGNAIWRMIIFNHNMYQVEQCRQLSIQYGFKNFQPIVNDRGAGPVFDKNGKLIHLLDKHTGPTEFSVLFKKRKTDLVLVEDISIDRSKTRIMCKAKNAASIYVAANGEVYPCCWTGFFPRTYGHGSYYQAVNSQLLPLLTENNANDRPLNECINWFNEIENSWNIQTPTKDRLIICSDICGTKY